MNCMVAIDVANEHALEHFNTVELKIKNFLLSSQWSSLLMPIGVIINLVGCKFVFLMYQK